MLPTLWQNTLHHPSSLLAPSRFSSHYSILQCISEITDEITSDCSICLNLAWNILQTFPGCVVIWHVCVERHWRSQRSVPIPADWYGCQCKGPICRLILTWSQKYPGGQNLWHTFHLTVNWGRAEQLENTMRTRHGSLLLKVADKNTFFFNHFNN